MANQKKHRTVPVLVLVGVVLVPENAASAKSSSGVATERYREGWDSIFGKRQPVGQA